MAEFVFDHEELRRIARRWGIRWPVEFQRRRYTRWYGSHGIVPGKGGRRPIHLIRFGRGGLPVMLATICHEFQHALQTERLGRKAFARVYWSDPAMMECDAERAEERWRELLPAVRPTKGVELHELIEEHDQEVHESGQG